MATPVTVGTGIASGLGEIWPAIGAGLAYELGSSIYRRLRQRTSTRTKFGITNETKKYYKKGKFYRKSRYQFYKWISNGYNYRQDLAYDILIPSGKADVAFGLIGSTTIYDNLMEISNVQTNRMTSLKSLFDTYRCSGVSLTFKPYQVVKTDPASNTPNNMCNILLGIFTGNEWAMNNYVAPLTNSEKQKYVDMPFTRIIAADDDLRMYRPFRLKNYETGYLLTQTDAIFHHWCPVNIDSNENTLYLFGCAMGSIGTRTNTTSWNIGTIKISVYWKFRNSKI